MMHEIKLPKEIQRKLTNEEVRNFLNENQVSPNTFKLNIIQVSQLVRSLLTLEKSLIANTTAEQGALQRGEANGR
jgi:hypothetical protein